LCFVIPSYVNIIDFKCNEQFTSFAKRQSKCLLLFYLPMGDSEKEEMLKTEKSVVFAPPSIKRH
jgi:hypothetical protein